MKKTIRTGLVGYGLSGKVFHAPFLHVLPEFEWVGVVERNRREAEKTYPYLETFQDLNSMLEREDIDLIIITTPNETHFPFAKLALEHGKHVVLEKPFANNIKEAEQLVQLSEKSSGILSVYQNRRYVGDFKTIAKLKKENLLGTFHEYICHFDRFRDAPKPGNAWREKSLPGSGVLFDLGSHLIDQALCLFGLPDFLTAFIKAQRPFSLVDDYFDIRLDYEKSGLSVILKSGMLVREMGPRYTVHGHEGSYIKYGDDPQEALLKNGYLPNSNNWGQEPAEQYGMLHTNIDEKIQRGPYPTLPGNYGEYYLNLYESITNHKEVTEKPAHGFNTIKLIELAFESSERKQTVPCAGLMHVAYPESF